MHDRHYTADAARELFDSGAWFKSSASANSANCVEMAVSRDGQQIGVRHSKEPDAGVLVFTRSEVAAWIAGAKNGEFDELA